jgi:hypothetical protein
MPIASWGGCEALATSLPCLHGAPPHTAADSGDFVPTNALSPYQVSFSVPEFSP